MTKAEDEARRGRDVDGRVSGSATVRGNIQTVVSAVALIVAITAAAAALLK